MKKIDIYNRRRFLRQGFSYASMLAVGGIVWAACNSGNVAKEQKPAANAAEEVPASPDPCDVTSLTEQDAKNRKALGYVEHTPIPEKNCEGCKLFIPANNTKQCGTCSLFKGPVAQEGYCTYWADKTI
ncbi:MAG: high-potential iron-sulfur protein [Agriterribacter sp.]